MDSGNSSSMQSSSGGDDQEYDSRSFLPPPQPPPQPPQQPPHLHLQQSIFQPPPDPNFLQQFSDRDLFSWPPPPPPLLRSDPSYLSFSDSPIAVSSQAPPPQAPPVPPKAAAGPSKNPKKRTRASRRAPTTVLTTDTTNFRAMVQEFTGIPDPPFSAAASAYSRRLDFLGTAGASMRLAAAAFGGGGPLRPTPQRRPPSNSNIIIPSSSGSAGLLEAINQGGTGQMGQSDPILAFLQQPHQLGYQPQPLSNNNAAFGMNIGLLEHGLSNNPGLINSQGIGLESSASLLRMDPHQQHGGSTANNSNNNDDDNNDNNNYGMMSCGAMTSSPSTDIIRPPQGEYRNE